MSDEKNIHVTRGIPVTPSVSGSGASHYSSFSLGLSNGLMRMITMLEIRALHILESVKIVNRKSKQPTQIDILL